MIILIKIKANVKWLVMVTMLFVLSANFVFAESDVLSSPNHATKENVAMTYSNHGFHYSVTPMNDSQQEFVDKQISKILSRIISNEMTDEQKAKVVYYYIVTNIEFSPYFGPSNRYKALAFGKTDSINCAWLYKMMLDNLGIENTMVYGRVSASSLDSNAPTAHVWNLVKLGDEWYHFDCSYGSISNDRYCGVSDSVLENAGLRWIKDNYPSASDECLDSDHENERISDRTTIELVDKYKRALKLASFALTTKSVPSIAKFDEAVSELPDYPEKEELSKLADGLRYFAEKQKEFDITDYSR